MAIASDYADLWAWYIGDAGDWSDQSGNGRDATLPESGPWISGTANGHDLFRFRARTHNYVSLPSMASLTAGEMFMVIAVVQDPQSDGAKTGAWYLGTSGNPTHLPWVDGTVYDMFGSTSRYTVGNPGVSMSGEVRVIDVWSAPNDWGWSIDGTTMFTSASNTVGFPATPVIGASNFGNYLDGAIAEVFFYSALRSGAERTALITSLQATYQGDFQGFPPPTMMYGHTNIVESPQITRTRTFSVASLETVSVGGGGETVPTSGQRFPRGK